MNNNSNYNVDIRAIIGNKKEFDIYITMENEFPVQGDTTFPVYLEGTVHIVNVFASDNYAEGTLSL